MRRTERSWPIASGVIDCGKTTVSFSGSTGSVAGNVISSSAAPGSSKLMSARGSSMVHLDHDAVARRRRLLRHGQRDRQEAAVVLRVRARRVDVLREADLPLE